MVQLLKNFNDDPEQLAKAFTDALNSELAVRQSKAQISKAANEVADAWNTFIDVYFMNKALPKGVTKKGLYQTEESVIAILQNILEIVPYLDILKNLPTAVSKAVEKAPVGKKINLGNTTATIASFDEVMRDFFKKNGIEP